MAKSVTIDGKTFEVADDVAAALDAAAKATQAKVADTSKSMADTLEAATKAVADMRSELDAAKKATPTADQVGKMAADLADARENAKLVAPTLDTRGLYTADAIKLATVKAIKGEDAVKDRSADYVNATFDMLVAGRSSVDPFADNLRNAQPVLDEAGKARSTYLDEQSKAWQH